MGGNDGGVRGVFVAVGADGLVMMWSAGAVALYGIDESLIIGRPHPILVPEGEADGLTELHEFVRNGGEFGTQLLRAVDGAGNTVEVEVTVDVLRDGDGGVFATVAHHRPVGAAADEDEDAEVRTADDALDVLCERHDLDDVERAIVVLLLRGHRTDSIARSLSYAGGTVRNRLSGMFPRFGVRSQSELIEVIRDELDELAFRPTID